MKFLFLLSVVALASSATVSNDESISRMVIGTFMDCVNSDVTLCLKEKALKATENLRAVREIDIFDGVTLHNNAPKEPRSLELSTETELRKQQVNDKLWESASDLLRNSELELSWSGSEDDEKESRDIGAEEGRGKKKQIKKKLKLLLPLLLIAKAKAGAIVVAALVIIAISIAKIAMLAKLAFIGKAIAIIKYLLHKKHSKEEIIIPYHDEHGAGWDQGGWNQGGWNQGGWQRRNDGNTLAYSAYAQGQ